MLTPNTSTLPQSERLIVGWHGSSPKPSSTQNSSRGNSAQVKTSGSLPAQSSVDERELSILASCVDLMNEILTSRTRQEACQRLAQGLRTYLSASRVAIGTCDARQRIRLAAVSDMASVSRDGPETARLEGQLRSTLSTTDHDRDAVTSFHLINNDGAIVAVCRVEFSQPPQSNQLKQFLAVAPSHLGVSLAAVPISVSWNTRAARQFTLYCKSWKLTAAIAAVSLALTIIPIADPIYCRCTIEPSVRRYVAAPFAGILEEAFVRPGDHVIVGQILARLDGRELRNELTQLRAEYQRAAKSQDIELAAGKPGAAQIHKLEMGRLDEKCRLIELRLSQLEVRSPLDGVILAGDLQRSQGVPLSVGQTLFEVAPLDRVCVEIAIDDHDIDLTQVRQPVRVSIDGKPWQSWHGEVEHIHPRAEIRDGNNVFVAEMGLDDADELQPGMAGRATLYGERRPLGWILVRNLLWRMSQWLG